MGVPDQTGGILRVTTGASLISFSAVFVKLLDADPSISAFYRMIIGGVVLLGLTLAREKKLSLARRHFFFVAAGGLFLALDLALWHRSILYVGPGLATLLANFQVFFMAAAGLLFFKERVSWRVLGAVPLAVLGLYLIVGFQWKAFTPDYRFGILLGLIAALCYAGYLVFLRMARMISTSIFGTVTLATLSTAFFLALISLGGRESFAVAGLGNWGILVAYALVPQVVGWLLITSGIGRIEASKAGLILLLQPTLAFVWDVLFFKRPTTVVEIAGALLAFFAIYLGSTAGATGRGKGSKERGGRLSRTA